MTADGRFLAAWRLADGFMLLVFAFSVVVQVNDPDPTRWMAIYGMAALACGLSLARRVPQWLPALVGVLALAWSATIAPRVTGQFPFADLFDAFEMRDVGVEEAREMSGLLITAVWMAAVAARARRSSAQRP